MSDTIDPTVTIALADAEIIRRWFMPTNPNKIRRPRDMESRRTVQAACRRFLVELGNAQVRNTVTTLYMPRSVAQTLKRGDSVRVLVAGCGDVEGKGQLSFDAGDILTVGRVDVLPAPQGLAITVYAENGVVNVFDEADFLGLFPFVRIVE